MHQSCILKLSTVISTIMYVFKATLGRYSASSTTMCQYWDNRLIYRLVYWLFYWHVPIVTHWCAIVTTHFQQCMLIQALLSVCPPPPVSQYARYREGSCSFVIASDGDLPLEWLHSLSVNTYPGGDYHWLIVDGVDLTFDPISGSFCISGTERL